MAPQVGDRVELVGLGEPDPYTRLQPGTQGTVRFVDSMGTVHVDWDDGSTIGLVTEPMPGDTRPFRPDRFRTVADAALGAAPEDANLVDVARREARLPGDCTGYIDPGTGSLQHDGETCPIHEGGGAR